MSRAVAYALRADLEGTVEVSDDEDGTTEAPIFTGGVLAVGDGDFHVRDQLDAGEGTIVVREADSRLVEVLDAYPALKRVEVPEGRSPISTYERQATDSLRHQAQLRQFIGVSNGRGELIRRLEAQDVALEAGDQVLANAIAANEVAPPPPDDGLDALTVAKLLELVPDGTTLPSDPKKADIIAALRDAGITAPKED